MKATIRICVLALMAAGASMSHAQSGFQVEIAQYEWPQEPSVDRVLQIPQFRSAIARYDEAEEATLIIRYPGGDEGNAWAESLRDSLVSLGIRSARILLEPGSGIPETILLIVAEMQDY